MEIYTALYDPAGIYLLAQRRVLTSWRDGLPRRNSVVEKALHYVLPSGIQRPNETYFTAAMRIFIDQTGYDPRPNATCHHHRVGDGYAVVCFEVPSIVAFYKDITKGLKACPEQEFRPVNQNIVSWELEMMVPSRRNTLESFLCDAQTAEERRFERLGLEIESRRRNTEIVRFLETVG